MKVLPDLIAQANPSKQFIITTRRSVQQTEMKRLPPALARVEHELLPEHYSRDARRRIFAQSLRGAAPWQRDWASRHLHDILNGLAAPLALDSCARLIKQAADENRLSIDKLIKRCNVEVLADTFAQEIIGRKGDAIEAVLALWAWQTSERAVSETAAGTLRNTLAAGGLTPVPDVRKLHQWLGSSGWWESAPEGLVAHPTVLAGAESLAKEEPEIAERVFGALLLGLVTSGDAGRALTIRQQVQKHLSSIAEDVERAVAKFAVESLLTTSETEWQQAFYRAQALDLKSSPVATLLMSLRTSSEGFLERWTAPELSPEEVASIQASPEAREVARRWVLTVLPHAESYNYDGEEVAHFLQRFGFDFSDELFAVAAEELEKGYGSRSVGIVVEATLSGPKPRFEEMLTLALASREDAERFEGSNKEALRKADQEEIDEFSYESLNDDLISAFAASEAALQSIVASRRRREGWRWLLEEGRPAILKRFWTVVIKADATVEELAAIEQVFRGAEREYYWQAVASAQRHDLVPQLLSEFPQMEGEQLEKCITHASKLIAPENWSRLIPAAVARMEWPRRATLTRFRRPPMPGSESSEWMPGAFSADERAALALCDAAAKGNLSAPTASPETRLLLRELATEAEPHLAGLALVALASLKEEITAWVPRLEGSGERVAKMAALVAQHFANSPDLPGKLQAALGDPHFRIRAAAVDMLAPTADETCKAAILKMAAEDPSAPVRRLCAAVIAREQWPEGEDVLVALLDDRHNYGTPNEEGPDFRVARAAAEGLRSKRELKKSTVERIHTILTGKSQRQCDVRVLYTLSSCLAGQDDDRIVPLLVRSLRSPWYVPAYRNAGYPLRYAAGWALWHHLHLRTQDRKLVELKPIGSAAAHDDDRLAAPALLVLGLLQERGLLQLREVVESSTFTPERALLVLLTAEGAASRDLLHSVVGDAHPVWAFFNLPLENRPRSQDAWRSFLSAQQEFLGWLRTIRSDDGLLPTIRFTWRALLGFEDPEELPPGDPFDEHFPQHPQFVAAGTFPIRD